MRLSVFLFTLLLPSAVFAGFGVATGASTAPPDDGFSKAADYDAAANGRTILNPAEQREMQRFLSKPVNNSFYVRAEYLQAKVQLNSFKQYPSPTYNTLPTSGSSATVTETSATRTATPYGLAWGYKNIDWRFEFLFFHLPKVDYVANPVLNTPIPSGPSAGDSVAFQGSNKGDALFVNFIRDFPMAFYMSPYIGVGVGLAYQSMQMSATDSTLGTPIESKNNHNLDYAGNAVVGLRLRLLENLWVNGA